MTEKNELDVLDVPSMADEVDVSKSVILQALRSGDLPGNNLHGRKGWVSTRRALTSWAEGRRGRPQPQEDGRVYREDGGSNGES